jgi:predicted nucleic acid-binding protein
VSEDRLAAEPNITRYSVPPSKLTDFISKYNFTDLHIGEQECLFLCQQRKIPLILTDDLAVREAAKRLKVVPVGSLGIIVAAYEREVASLRDAERYIADLYEVSSLFVTRAIVDMSCRGREL